MGNLPHQPNDQVPYNDEDVGELFESERNIERISDYLDLINATDVDHSGAFEDENLAVHFTVVVNDPPQEFGGFACFVKDTWVDICLLRDWSSNIRIKFRDRAADIMNTIGLHGVSLYFMPDEDTLYMSHRVFSEGLNFDVFRACVWSLIAAQSCVAAILEQGR